jgi:large subunit ribosomal protein L29
MKTAELHERSVGDLTQLENELTRDLWKARFANYTNQLDDTAKIRRLRREISRVKTILVQKAAAAEKKS